MLEYIAIRDHRLMQRVNNWHPPRWIRLWAIAATRAGDGWLWYALLPLFLVFGGPERWIAAACCGTAALTGVVTFISIKRKTSRKRPCAIATHCWANLLPPDQFSFPSGHTITAFAITVPLSLFYPSLAAALLFCAVSIGASRILLGMHFLSDVVAGAVLGSLIGYGCYMLYV